MSGEYNESVAGFVNFTFVTIKTIFHCLLLAVSTIPLFYHCLLSNFMTFIGRIHWVCHLNATIQLLVSPDKKGLQLFLSGCRPSFCILICTITNSCSFLWVYETILCLWPVEKNLTISFHVKLLYFYTLEQLTENTTLTLWLYSLFLIALKKC